VIFAPAQLSDVAKSSPVQQIASVSRGNDFGSRSKFSKRAPVRVIEVSMGQQNDVDLWKLIDGECRRGQPLGTNRKQEWNPNSDAWKENGVSQNIDPEKIYQNGRMSESGCCYLRVAPFGRVWLRECRFDRLPIFQNCFAPQVGSPSPNTRISVTRLYRHTFGFNRNARWHEKTNAVIKAESATAITQSDSS
jgi:hypothetical protein